MYCLLQSWGYIDNASTTSTLLVHGNEFTPIIIEISKGYHMTSLYELLKVASASDLKTEERISALDDSISEVLSKDMQWASDPIEFSQLASLFKNPGYIKSFKAAYAGFLNVMMGIPNVAIKGEAYIKDFYIGVLPKKVEFYVSYKEPFIDLFGYETAVMKLKSAMIESSENLIPAFESYGEVLLDDNDFKMSLISRVAPRYSLIDYAFEANLLKDRLPKFQEFLAAAIYEDYKLARQQHQTYPSVKGAEWLLKRIGVEKLLDIYDFLSPKEDDTTKGENLSALYTSLATERFKATVKQALLNTLREVEPNRLNKRYPDLGGEIVCVLSDTKPDTVYVKSLARAYPEHKRLIIANSLEI